MNENYLRKKGFKGSSSRVVNPYIILDKVARLKVDVAEVYFKEWRNTTIESKNMQIESMEVSKNIGIALRLLKDRRLGFSFSTSLDEMSVDELISNAFYNSRYVDEDEWMDIPYKDSRESGGFGELSRAVGSQRPDIYDEKIDSLSEEDTIKHAFLLEESAFMADKRIKKVRKAVASFSVLHTSLLNTRGIDVSYKSTIASASIMVVAESTRPRPDSQMAWEFDIQRFLDKLDFKRVGVDAAYLAVALLGAEKSPSGKVPVILSNKVAVEFLGVIAPALFADNVQKGKSLFENKIGTQVAFNGLELWDDGTLPGCIGSSPVDDEGVPMQRKLLIKDGILKGFLHNTYTAKKGGTTSTGNAERGGFNGLPTIGVTNFYIEKGNRTKDSLIEDVSNGIYITDAMGIHTANPISGDFSVGISGFWIKNGVIAYPVREAVFSGNIFDMLQKINGIGDDIRFYGRIGSPSISLSEMDISGQ